MSRYSIIALVAVVALTITVLMLSTETGRRMQGAVLGLVRPVHIATTGVGSKVGAFSKGLKNLDELERDNQQLTVQNQRLRAENTTMLGLAEENATLRRALDYRQRSSYSLLPARIIARSAATWWNTVQIDRGEQDGLDSDMPVVTDIGLVGKTTTVGKNSAYVLLVLDENCKVAAKIDGTREQGILSGQRVPTGAQPDMVLDFLSKNATLKAGQKVYSSGVSGGVFPSDLLIGTVRSFTPRVLDGRATVAPAVDLASLENVFIVLGSKKAPPPPPRR